MVGTWAHPCLRMRCEQIVNNFSRRPYAPRPVRSRASQEVWPSLENLSTFLATGGLLRSPLRFCVAVPCLPRSFPTYADVRAEIEVYSRGGKYLQAEPGVSLRR